MSELTQKHCVPCEGGVPPLGRDQIQKLLEKLPQWKLETLKDTNKDKDTDKHKKITNKKKGKIT